MLIFNTPRMWHLSSVPIFGTKIYKWCSLSQWQLFSNQLGSSKCNNTISICTQKFWCIKRSVYIQPNQSCHSAQCYVNHFSRSEQYLESIQTLAFMNCQSISKHNWKLFPNDFIATGFFSIKLTLDFRYGNHF
jgi:hypothetical protein